METFNIVIKKTCTFACEHELHINGEIFLFRKKSCLFLLHSVRRLRPNIYPSICVICTYAMHTHHILTRCTQTHNSKTSCVLHHHSVSQKRERSYKVYYIMLCCVSVVITFHLWVFFYFFFKEEKNIILSEHRNCIRAMKRSTVKECCWCWSCSSSMWSGQSK